MRNRGHIADALTTLPQSLLVAFADVVEIALELQAVVCNEDHLCAYKVSRTGEALLGQNRSCIPREVAQLVALIVRVKVARARRPRLRVMVHIVVAFHRRRASIHKLDLDRGFVWHGNPAEPRIGGTAREIGVLKV